MKGVTVSDHQLLECLRESADRIVFRGRCRAEACVTRVILRPVPLPLGGLISGVVRSGVGSLAGLDDEVIATLEGYRVRCRLGDPPGLPAVLEAGLASSPSRCPSGTGLPFVTTRWIPGRTLSSAGATRAQRETVLHNVLDILESLHSKNTVYGDLKPANVVINGSAAHLIDLDTLREVADARHPIQVTHRTPRYAAPEQEATPPLSYPSSDIFTFGLVVCEVLGGVRRGEVGFPPRLSPPWDTVVDACFRHHPLDRPSAAAIRQLLDGDITQLPTWDGQPLKLSTEPVRDHTQPVADLTDKPPLPTPPVFDMVTRTISRDGIRSEPEPLSWTITRAGPLQLHLPPGGSAFTRGTVAFSCAVVCAGEGSDPSQLAWDVQLSSVEGGALLREVRASSSCRYRGGSGTLEFHLDSVPAGEHTLVLTLSAPSGEDVVLEASVRCVEAMTGGDHVIEIPATVTPTEAVRMAGAEPKSVRRRGGAWLLWLVVLLVIGMTGGLLVGAAWFAQRYQTNAAAREQAAVLMDKLKEHKTVSEKNDTDTLNQIIVETERALDELAETPELLGLYALERVWMQKWHWRTSTWNEAAFQAGTEVVSRALEAGQTPAALLAKGVLYGGACKTMPARQDARRMRHCETSLDALDAAREQLPSSSEMDWFAVEVLWSSVMTRWSISSYLEPDSEHAQGLWADAMDICAVGVQKLSAAPVNGRYLVGQCLSVAGALREYGQYLVWADWLLTDQSARSRRPSSSTALKLVQSAAPACAELEFDGREWLLNPFVPGSIEELCGFMGLVAMGCDTRAQKVRQCRPTRRVLGERQPCLDPVVQDGVPWEEALAAAESPARQACYWSGD